MPRVERLHRRVDSLLAVVRKAHAIQPVTVRDGAANVSLLVTWGNEDWRNAQGTVER